MPPRFFDKMDDFCGDELRQNGHEVMHGNLLKTLKLAISSSGGSETYFVTKTNVHGG